MTAQTDQQSSDTQQQFTQMTAQTDQQLSDTQQQFTQKTAQADQRSSDTQQQFTQRQHTHINSHHTLGINSHKRKHTDIKDQF